jgi:uncharacterized protein
MPPNPDTKPTGGLIVIAGGSGFLGLNLAQHLSQLGYRIAIIARRKPVMPKNMPWNPAWTFTPWDGRTLDNWASMLDGAAAIVNLAGRTVDCIKTPDHCDQILRSRVESTLVLGKAVRAVQSPPAVWVQMSTAHLYGDSVDCVCDEDAPFGYGLAPFVGKAWEEAHAHAAMPNMRSVILRTSFVLGRSGGALRRLASIARLGLGGTVGSGKQGISWIHELDMNRIFQQAITDDSMRGAYIATAPNPVSNAQFMRELRKSLGMPIGLPAMAWMVKLGAPLVLRTDPELALYGRYCIPKRLQHMGFQFKFPEISPALRDLSGR